nr:MAG TPA: hypothetical protein [Caudoviricetes sp.]
MTPGTKRGGEPLPAKCSFGTRSSIRTACWACSIPGS